MICYIHNLIYILKDHSGNTMEKELEGRKTGVGVFLGYFNNGGRKYQILKQVVETLDGMVLK